MITLTCKKQCTGSFLRKVSMLLFSLLFVHCATAQTYEEKYNLSFNLNEQRIPSWASHPNHSKIIFAIDSTDIELPLRIYQSQFWNAREKLRFLILSREILLPEDIKEVIN